jgi:sulfur-oxidizing protein SoxZ
MTKLTRIRARRNGERTEILVLVKHPMNGTRRAGAADEAQDPGYYIREMTFTLNGRAVAVAELGPGVADDPLTGVAVTGARAGDKLAVSWSDNLGATGGAETILG